MRRKEGRGGKRGEESEKMKKLLKNEKSLKDASLASLGLVYRESQVKISTVRKNQPCYAQYSLCVLNN